MSNRPSRARRIANAPIFGLTLGVLIGLAGAASAAPALPTGGVVKAGSAVITASSPSYLTINQSSTDAVINWPAFSIAEGGTVQFNNGSGATLNRVTGSSISNINGLLSATGSVYLINPNGVIIGKTGVANTGGTFVASTQDLSNANFMSGGALTFSGSSNAQVLNLGKIGSLGGDVALIGSMVENDGQITAAKGDVGLAAGYQVTLADATQSDGKFQVLVGGSGTSATNRGAIEAAEVELRANGGNVLALAGNTASVIEATGVSNNDGKVLLIADGGAVTATGTIAAKTSSGAGGQVETSGASVDFTGVTVKAGQWLIDPTDLTVNSGAAATIDNSLAAGTSVTLQTTASSSSGPGVANSSGSGDIIVAAPIAWSTTATLTLDAYHSIAIDAPITVSGAGGVVLTTNDGGTGGDYGFGLTSKGFSGSLSFTGAEGGGQSLTINGQAYTLLYELAEPGSTGPDSGADDIAGIDANTAAGGDAGFYALANNFIGTGTTFTGALAGAGVNTFTGVFTGLGHTITGLTINDTINNVDDGLFGQQSGGAIRAIGLVGGSVSSNGGFVGGLVGSQQGGAITDAYATGAVSGAYYLGGLVGAQYSGSITDAYATGAVSGNGYAGGLVGAQFSGAVTDSYATGAVSGRDNAVGGLAGYADGTITDADATGAVSGTGYVGGLVGFQYAGSITDAYATGAVSGSNSVGGLVGSSNSATITEAYWDTQTTGQSGSSGGTGLTTAQLQSGAAVFSDASFSGGTNGLYPYLINFFPNGIQPASGFAYTNAGATPNASGANGAVPVSLTVAGTAEGSADTGANGYYYFALPAGTINTTTGSSVLASTAANVSTGSVDAASFTQATGSVSGLNVYGGDLLYATHALLYSTSGYGAAQTTLSGYSATNPAFLSSLTPGVLAEGSSFTLDTALDLTSSLAVYTNATGADLTVVAPITLAGANSLTLGAAQQLAIDAPITVTGAGVVDLAYNTATPTNLSFGLIGSGFSGSLSFTNTEGGGQSLTINGQAYTLLYRLAETGSTGPDSGTDDIAGIDAVFNDDSGYYALANNLIGTGTTFTGALAGAGGNTFIGVFTGLGHTITGLTINDTSGNSDDGLFGLQSGGAIRDIGLVGGSVSGGGDDVGGLVGNQNGGAITDAYTTGAVSGRGYGVGGLVGYQGGGGSITDAYATGAVSGNGEVGGLEGYNNGTITDAYATGAVSGGSHVGGLVGDQQGGAITDAYATGAVSGAGVYVGGLVGYGYNVTITDTYATGAVSGNGVYVGGLVGNQISATITDGYWDTQTTGQSGSSGGGTGLTTAQLQSGSASLDASFSGGTNGLYPYLTNFYPTGVQAVSGVAYTDAVNRPNASGANGVVTVGLTVGGSAEGSAATGANGYYYVLLPAGTINTTSGSSVLAYTTANNATGSVDAATLQTSATGSLSGFNLDGGWLVETAGSSIGSLSALDAAYATAAAGTPAASFALVNQQITTAATSFNLDTATSLTGTLALASDGAVTQSAAIDAGALSLGGSGGYGLNNTGNQITTLAANAGAVSVTNAAGLTIGSVTDATGASTVGVTSTGAVNVAAAGALTIASGASVSAGSGDDVTLSATGAFTNDAGASAVTVSGGGRWLIYSANPTGDVFGDLNSGATAVWDTAAGGSVGVSGDRYVFAYQPTLTVTTQNASKTYGTNDGAALQSAYAISGLQAGVSGAYLADTASAVYSGAPTISSSGSGADANASVVNGGNYGISAAAGTLNVGDGYAVAFANTGQLTVNPLAVTLSGSQVYNAGVTAEGANLTVINAVNGGAAVTVGGTATMAGASAGPESLANLSSLTLSSGDYTVAGGSGSVTVTPEAITITASTNSKTYDSTIAASATPTVTSGTLYDAGGSTLAETYTTANAGTGLTLLPTASIPGASNYTVTLASVNTGVITPEAITITAGANSKTYDSTTSASVTPTVTSGILYDAGGSTLAEAYTTANAGTGLTLVPTASIPDASNYTVTLASVNTGAIGPEAITITASTNSKTYDTTTSASAAPTVTSGTLYDASSSTLAESYTTANAGTGLTLVPTASIPDDSNYTVTLASTNTGVITPEAITITAATNSKTYDSTSSASVAPAVTSGTLYDASSSTLAEAYTTANAGTGLTLVPTASIPDAFNYTVTLAAVNTGVIIPEAITITAATNSKTYDGTTSATATPMVTSGTLYDAGSSTLAETYASANIGTELTLTPTASIPDASNYTVTLASVNTGAITPAPIRITVYPPPPTYQPAGQGAQQSWNSSLGWAPYQWSFAHDTDPPSIGIGEGAGTPPSGPDCPADCNAPAYSNWHVSPQIVFVSGL